jgi:hypothetical protein
VVPRKLFDTIREVRHRVQLICYQSDGPAAHDVVGVHRTLQHQAQAGLRV